MKGGVDSRWCMSRNHAWVKARTCGAHGGVHRRNWENDINLTWEKKGRTRGAHDGARVLCVARGDGPWAADGHAHAPARMKRKHNGWAPRRRIPGLACASPSPLKTSTRGDQQTKSL